MRIEIELSTKIKEGFPTVFITATKDGVQYDLPYRSELTLGEILSRFETLKKELKKTEDDKNEN